MIRSLLATAVLVGSGLGLGGAAATPTASALDDTPWELPTTPPRCTRAEASSGNVAHCLLAFYEDPSTTGWGEPPAPGVGEGWTWNGSRYNGSAGTGRLGVATDRRERRRLGAGSRAGQLETHVAAQPLFEGFLARDHRARGTGSATRAATRSAAPAATVAGVARPATRTTSPTTPGAWRST